MRKFLFGAENYFWTKRGLLKGYELTKGDYILGVLRGEETWVNISTSPKIISGVSNSRIISDRTEPVLPLDVFLSIGRTRKQVRNLSSSDYLEMINPSRNVLNRECDPTLDLDLAYILGMLTRRSSIFMEAIPIKVASNQNINVLENNLSIILKEKLNASKDNVQSIEGRPFSFLILGKESGVLSLIRDFNLKKSNVPFSIRTDSLQVIESFLKGFIDVAYNYEEKKISFMEYETDIRKFLFNILSFSHISSRVQILSYTWPSLIDLSFKEDLELPLNNEKVEKIRYPYSRIRGFSIELGDLCVINEEKLNWRPIVDLVPLIPYSF